MLQISVVIVSLGMLKDLGKCAQCVHVLFLEPAYYCFNSNFQINLWLFFFPLFLSFIQVLTMFCVYNHRISFVLCHDRLVLPVLFDSNIRIPSLYFFF